MNMLLYNDGRLVMNEQGKPLEGQENDLNNLYAYVADPADGDTLVYDGTARCWKVGHGGGGSFAPDITDPQDGDTLVYNATQQKWVNGAGGGAFIVNAVDYPEDLYYQLDKTWLEIRNALLNGGRVILAEIFGDESYVNSYYSVISIREEGSTDSLQCYVDTQNSGRSYTSNSETDYPKYSYGD